MHGQLTQSIPPHLALELSRENPATEDVASKFFEHFVAITDAMNSLGGHGLWDEVDGFYYDQLHVDGRNIPLKVRSLVGAIPLIAVEVLDSDLEMLRRIDPDGGEPADLEPTDLEGAWASASASIVEEHNRRADPRAAQDAIGPAQRWALELLRDPTVILPEGAERAADALAVERSTAVRRELNGISAETKEERISRNDAARRVVELVDRLGLQPVTLDDTPPEITEDDLGVVCWMAVLPAG